MKKAIAILLMTLAAPTTAGAWTHCSALLSAHDWEICNRQAELDRRIDDLERANAEKERSEEVEAFLQREKRKLENQLSIQRQIARPLIGARICAAALAVAFSVPVGAQNNIVSAGEMAVACRGVEAANALHDKDLLYIDTPGARECWAAFQTIQLMAVGPFQKEFDARRICFPGNLDAGGYVSAFLRYVEAHPKETAGLLYTDVAIDAFSLAFPCKAKE
jgi:hypothetical protein